MQIKFSLTILALISSLTTVMGQESKNELQLKLGFGSIARQDLIFSPFIHKDITPVNIGLQYERKGNFYQQVSLRYASFAPILTDPYEFIDNNETEVTNPHYFTLIDLDYWFGKEIRASKKTATTLGAAFNADVQALNYSYGRVGSFGYYSSFGLGGFIKHSYKFNERSTVSGQLSLPLVSWLARSPYLVNDDEFIKNISSHSGVKTFFAFLGDGELVTLNTLQTLDFGINYSYSLNTKWNLGAAYLFEFLHSKEPKNLLSFRNSIYLTTSIKF